MRTNPPGRVDSKFDPFKHDASSVDPSILAVPPHDPYSLVAPGHLIEEGDIKRIVGDGNRWVAIEAHEVGHKVPVSGVAYARVEAPEGYRVARGDDRVNANDIVWLSDRQHWAAPGDELLDRHVDEVQKEGLEVRNQLIFIAKLDPAFPVHRASEVPARHRLLYPGEKLRRGDKLIYTGRTAWESVTEEARGQVVTAPDALNGEARYCRPVDAHFQTWYVSESGNEKNMGGAADPWPSTAVAERRIEHAAKSAGVAPHGIILENGVPKMVYDLPEPVEKHRNYTSDGGLRDSAIDAIIAEEDQRIFAVLDDVTKGAAEAKTASEIKEEARKRPLKEPKRRDTKEPPPEETIKNAIHILQMGQLAQRLECTVAEVREDAERQLPRGYRIMVDHEEFGRGDLMYQLDEELETGTWKTVPGSLFGAAVWLGPDAPLFARKTLAPKNLRVLELLNHAHQQHIELGETIVELKALLNQQ